MCYYVGQIKQAVSGKATPFTVLTCLQDNINGKIGNFADTHDMHVCGLCDRSISVTC